MSTRQPTGRSKGQGSRAGSFGHMLVAVIAGFVGIQGGGWFLVSIIGLGSWLAYTAKDV